MSFEDRTSHEQMRLLYDRLSLANFDVVEPRMRSYLDALAGYKKNEFAELSPPLKNAVANAWRRSFDEWGYAL